MAKTRIPARIQTTTSAGNGTSTVSTALLITGSTALSSRVCERAAITPEAEMTGIASFAEGAITAVGKSKFRKKRIWTLRGDVDKQLGCGGLKARKTWRRFESRK